MTPHRTPHALSTRTPWRTTIADGVLLCRHKHALLRGYTIRGVDVIGEDPETIGARMLKANQALKNLHGPWTLHAEAQRVPLQHYPVRRGRFVIPTLIDEDRRQALLDPETGVWETRYFCTLTWVPPKGQTRAVALFRRAADNFMDHLQTVLAEMTPMDNATLATTLKTTVSLRWHPVEEPEPGTDWGKYLCDSAWHGGRYPEWDATLGQEHVRVLTLTGYPRRTWAIMMQRLESLGVRFRQSTRWSGIEPHFQDPLLFKMQKDWKANERTLKQRADESFARTSPHILNSDSTRQVEDLDEVRQDIGAGFYGLGQFSTTILTWADSAAVVEDQANKIRQALEWLGFVVRREGDYGSRTPMATWALQYLAPPHHSESFLAAMPGNMTDGIRKTLQSTLAVTHLLPGLRSVWPGPEQDEHLQAPPWFLAHTEQSSVVRVCHYVRDVGHSMLLGNTGSGKSTFIGFGMAQWLMYDDPPTQGTIFDVGRTARALTLLTGGEWLDLSQAALQPLRDIDQPAEFRWALTWLVSIVERAKVESGATTQEYLKERLDELVKYPKEVRTMTRLLEICQLHSNRIEARVTTGVGTRDASGLSRPNEHRQQRLELHRNIQRAVRPFTRDGEYGGILDGVQERVLTSHLVVFEHMDIVKTPGLLEAVSQYCFHLTERRLDTRRPMWIVMEEAPLLATMPHYKEQFDAWLLTIRKAGGSLALVINSLEQAANLGVGILTSENTPHRWYFPNVEALTPQTGKVYDLFGLTQEEKRLIATARAYRDIYYVCRERGRRMIHLPLSPFILDCIARNTDEDHALMDDILQAEGREGFAAGWMRHHGYEAAAVAVERGARCFTASLG